MFERLLHKQQAPINNKDLICFRKLQSKAINGLVRENRWNIQESYSWVGWLDLGSANGAESRPQWATEN